MNRVNILSAWVETTRLGHLVSELPLGTQVPNKSCDAENNGAEDGSVGLPVGRLGVPTTGWRPDVLGVAVICGIAKVRSWVGGASSGETHGTLGPPPYNNTLRQ